MPSATRALLARKIPEVAKTINPTSVIPVMESKQAAIFSHRQAEEFKTDREEYTKRKKCVTFKKTKFFSFKQFILKRSAKHDVNTRGNCAGLVLDFLNFCLLHEHNPNLSYAMVLEKLKAGDLDEIERIYFYQMNQDSYHNAGHLIYNNKIVNDEVNEETLSIAINAILFLLKEHKTLYITTGQHALGLKINSITNEILFFEPNIGLFIYPEIDNFFIALLKDCICRVYKTPVLHLTVRKYSREMLRIPEVLKPLPENILFPADAVSLPVEAKDVSIEEQTIALIEQKKYAEALTIAEGKQVSLESETKEVVNAQLDNLKTLAKKLSNSQEEAVIVAELEKSCYLVDSMEGSSEDHRLAVIEQHKATLAFVANQFFPPDSLYRRDIVRIKLHLAICLLRSGMKEEVLEAFREVEKQSGLSLLGFYEFSEFCYSYLPLIDDPKHVRSIIVQLISSLSKYDSALRTSLYPYIAVLHDFIAELKQFFKLKVELACLRTYADPDIRINSCITWNLPVANKEWFTDRVTELEKSTNSFSRSVIFGTGSTGKTQLASCYIHHMDYVPLRVWFNASDEATLLAEYRKFAQDNKLKVDINASEDKLIFAVYLFVKQHPYFILVYDNAGNYNSISKYLPLQCRNGHVVITTRLRMWIYAGKPIMMKSLNSADESLASELKESHVPVIKEKSKIVPRSCIRSSTKDKLKRENRITKELSIRERIQLSKDFFIKFICEEFKKKSKGKHRYWKRFQFFVCDQKHHILLEFQHETESDVEIASIVLLPEYRLAIATKKEGFNDEFHIERSCQNQVLIFNAGVLAKTFTVNSNSRAAIQNMFYSKGYLAINIRDSLYFYDPSTGNEVKKVNLEHWAKMMDVLPNGHIVIGHRVAHYVEAIGVCSYEYEAPVYLNTPDVYVLWGLKALANGSIAYAATTEDEETFFRVYNPNDGSLKEAIIPDLPDLRIDKIICLSNGNVAICLYHRYAPDYTSGILLFNTADARLYQHVTIYGGLARGGAFELLKDHDWTRFDTIHKAYEPIKDFPNIIKNLIGEYDGCTLLNKQESLPYSYPRDDESSAQALILKAKTGKWSGITQNSKSSAAQERFESKGNPNKCCIM